MGLFKDMFKLTRQANEPGRGIVCAMGIPARAAQWFNLDIDLEVHVGGASPTG